MSERCVPCVVCLLLCLPVRALARDCSCADCSLATAIGDAIAEGESSVYIDAYCESEWTETLPLPLDDSIRVTIDGGGSLVWRGDGEDGTALHLEGGGTVYLKELTIGCVPSATASAVRALDSTLDLDSIVFRDCADSAASGEGTALSAYGGQVSVATTLFSNAASATAAAVYADGASWIDIRQSSFTQDSPASVDEAWAVQAVNTTLSISNTVFVIEDTGGWAIHAHGASSGELQMRNSHLAASSMAASGLRVEHEAGGYVYNTLFMGHATAIDDEGATLDLDYNAWWDNREASTGGSYGANDVVDQDPELVSLEVCAEGDLVCASYGEVWPLPTSPLLDRGHEDLYDRDSSYNCRSDIGLFGGEDAWWPEIVEGSSNPGDADSDCAPDFADCAPEDSGLGFASWWYADDDGDGAYDVEPTAHACEAPSEGLTEEAGTDCDDGDGDAYPGAEEIVGDSVDQDCDGLLLCWPDEDGDGFVNRGADPISSLDACPGEELEDDCDDGDPETWPGAEDRLGDGDQDCDEWGVLPGALKPATCGCTSASRPGPRVSVGWFLVGALCAVRLRAGRHTWRTVSGSAPSRPAASRTSPDRP